MIWKACIKLIRPLNLLIMAGMLLLVRYAIFIPLFRYYRLEGLMPDWMFLLLVLSTILIGAGGYVVNDVLDIELDRINKPEKQVIGVVVSSSFGNNLHMGLTIAGVALGFVFSYLAGSLYLGVLFVIIPTALFYYSYKYKYLPLVGNLAVASLAAMTVIIYWLFEFYYLKSQTVPFIEASLYFPVINRFVISFAFFAFMTTLVREIIKDSEDITGDRRFGCRTIPVLIGIPRTTWLLFFLMLLILVSLSFFQFYLVRAGYRWMAYILGLSELILIFGMYKTLTAREKADFRRLSSLIKLLMVTGMISLAAIWLSKM